ncbi:sigma-70 family RNA polymerase sigma factor [Pseudalkalibacillus hwajinpoensis]|uniref:sigma-70 family RNA polymerase sigma factor n=1 Tax=Guptibacillus hwajinpoensis TaxID=208199 RepID=UPI001CFCE4A9|nr:sigma-70 family RNA polymerase sigma factor [Pseudalkalibacillus hwajinpoensis]
MHKEINDERVHEKNLDEVLCKLYRYCHHLTQNKWDGEEIAQETIYKALKNYKNHDHWSSALLKKIAYHEWIDRLRKQEKEALLSEIDLPDDVMVDQEICSEWLEKLLAQLTPKQFVTFVLKEAFQYKISEIAALLKMTDTGVKALLNRSRLNMRKLCNSGMDHDWSEDTQQMLLHVIVKSVHIQDPSALITLIPILINPKTTHSSPSNVLSLAA